MRSFIVQVNRKDDQWLATVEGIEGGYTFAHSLDQLDIYVREVLEALGVEGPVELTYSYTVGIIDDQVIVSALELQAALKAAAEAWEHSRNELAWIFKAEGLTTRDSGVILGVSHTTIETILDKGE